MDQALNGELVKPIFVFISKSWCKACQSWFKIIFKNYFNKLIVLFRPNRKFGQVFEIQRIK